MKTIIITGGSDGLGKALAIELSKNNKVIILARNKVALKEIAEANKCEWYECDIKNSSQVTGVISQIVKKHPQIDVLINNAGIVVNGELVDTSYDDIQSVIETNTLGTIYMAKTVLEVMKKQQSGLIVNVVSQSGLNARANRSIYNASKWALTGFTKALQDEVAPYGVRVTGFYPGTINTKMFAKAGIDLQGPSLTPNDVVEAISFLLSTSDNVLISELGIKHAARDSSIKN